MADRFQAAGEKFSELVSVMARLRAPGGCPWDRKQTFDSIKSHLLEETYEVLDAIDRSDWKGLEDELGDLLLQPVFLAGMAAEQGLFDIGASLDAINQKLVRRHPHIFSDAQAETAEDVKLRWDQIKKEERPERGTEPLLDSVLRNLPALAEAEKIGKKAAAEGFDWLGIEGAVEKVKEEVDELAEARQRAKQADIEDELGDLLFSVVNVARFLKVDPEQALRRSNGRFRSRFAQVEKSVAAEGRSMKDMPIERLEEYWQAAKRR